MSKKETMENRAAQISALFAEKQKLSGGFDTTNVLKLPEIPVGQSIVFRLVADVNATEENPFEGFHPYLIHWINGKPSVCLASSGHCPACDGKTYAYNQGADHIGKKMLAKKMLAVQGFLIECPDSMNDKKGRLLTSAWGVQVSNEMISSLGDLDSLPWAEKGGFDLKINVVDSGDFRKYTASFVRKASDLTKEQIEQAAEAVAFDTLVPPEFTAEHMEMSVQAYLRQEGVIAPEPVSSIDPLTGDEYAKDAQSVLDIIKRKKAQRAE